MSILSSIHLNSNVSEEALAAQRQEAIQYLSTYDQIHIGAPNKGDGAVRTVILGKEGGRWIQVIKIWGATKTQSYGYARKLAFEARIASEARIAKKIEFSAYKSAIRELAKANKPAKAPTYAPRSNRG